MAYLPHGESAAPRAQHDSDVQRVTLLNTEEIQ